MTAPTSYRGQFDPFTTTNAVMYDVLETIPDLQPGQTAVATFAQMRKDSRLAAVISGYTLQLRRASWQVEPGGCRPEVVQQVADDLGLPIAGEDVAGAARTRGVSWHEHLRSALLSLVYGHMAFELLAEVDGKHARLVALSERMPWTLSLIHADPKSGALLGVSQESTAGIETPQIKADRLAFYCHERENTWFGTSLLRPSYAPWFLKRELMRVHSTSARRFGMGVPTIEWAKDSNPTPQQFAEAQRIATGARVGDQAGASLPPGASLVLRGLSGGNVDVLSYIKWLNQEMAAAALMPHLDLGTSESGSRALGQSFLDSWMLALGAIAEEISDVATRQIAARIVGWNWGDDEQVPRIVASGVGAQRSATAESLQLLLTSGALTAEPNLEAWVRREYRLPEAAPLPVAAPGVTLPGQPGAQTTLPDGSMVPVPAGAASTDQGLVTAALTAATARNWGALDEVAAQMQAREAAAPPSDVALPAHWAAVADDAGLDWRVDAAMARGADIASAFASIYPGGDDNATRRGFDIWAADRLIAGDKTPATLDAFKALIGSAAAPVLSLDMDNRIVALAVRLGRFAALFAQPVQTCPYTGPDAEQTALRRVWLSSYLRLRPADTQATPPAPAPTAAKPATPAAPPAPPAAPAVKASERVLAAAGHPSSCAHATLGSVCHCECGGVRHSWLGGDVPSGVKAPLGDGLSGYSGSKPALVDAPGTDVPQAPQPAPQPAPAQAPPATSTPPAPAEPAPTPAPAAPTPPAAPPAVEPPPAPVAPRTFNERVAAALTDADARESAPSSLIRDGDVELTDAQGDALTEYFGENYRPVNYLLRGGDPAEMRTFYTDEQSVRGWIDSIDEAMANSPLPRDTVTYRGLNGNNRLFGDAFNGDLTGFEWREDAFASTTTDLTVAENFAGRRPGATVVRVLTPAGVGGIELSGGGENGESELLLDRGLSMRVVADHGVDPDGVRQLDVEVVPNARRPEEGDAARAEQPAGGQPAGDVGGGTAGGGLQPADRARSQGGPDPQVDGPPAGEGLADTRSYDERVDEALDGSQAHQVVPLSRVRDGDRELTAAETAVLTEYAGNGFLPINHLLRGGDPADLSRWNNGRDELLTEDMVNSWTGAIDELMSESRLGDDIVTWRGMRNGDVLFGPAFDGDLEGFEWREDAFSSTSTDETRVREFAGDELGNFGPGSTVMHILTPAGTGALEISDGSWESEILLDRGLRFRVVYDGGIDPDGVRHLDVEVVPGGNVSAAASTLAVQLELPIAASSAYDAARVAAELASAVSGFVSSWPALARPIVSGLVTDIGTALSGGNVGRLTSLAAGAGAVAALSKALGKAMKSLSRRAARRAAGEVQELGVNASAGTADAGMLQGQADVTADLVGQTLSAAAKRTALLHAGRDGKAVADAVQTELDELVQLKSGGYLLQNLEAALAAAQGAGRMATFEQVEDQISLMAMESNEGPSRCERCSDVDGKVYRTFAAAAAAYPAGKFIGCAGGSRCKGHLQPVRRTR